MRGELLLGGCQVGGGGGLLGGWEVGGGGLLGGCQEEGGGGGFLGGCFFRPGFLRSDAKHLGHQPFMQTT